MIATDWFDGVDYWPEQIIMSFNKMNHHQRAQREAGSNKTEKDNSP